MGIVEIVVETLLRIHIGIVLRASRPFHALCHTSCGVAVAIRPEEERHTLTCLFETNWADASRITPQEAKGLENVGIVHTYAAKYGSSLMQPLQSE